MEEISALRNSTSSQEAACELTTRQAEILLAVSRGEAAKSIAYRLQLSQRTVAYHTSRLQELFRASSIPALVALGIVGGILTSDQLPIQLTGQMLIDLPNGE
jgi:NarL family two-component system response regulator YdfI